MGHRQNMTTRQRLEWDKNNYINKLKNNKGHNYEYWNNNHDKLLDNGWEIFCFNNKSYSLMSEDIAKEKVEELRNENNFARIVCGFEQNIQRIKMYSVIYKPKKPKLVKIEGDEWKYKDFIIQKQEHPKLIGKYEVFRNDDNETHIDRCFTLKEAKEICDKN